MTALNYKQYFDLQEILKSIKEYLPKFDEKRFLEAFSFAEEAHRGQLRKDGKTPYIAHPVEVARILTGLHADEDTLISALLHDVPEDTKFDINQIKEKFGEKIGFLVDGITKLSKVYYEHNMPERQVESLKKLLLHTSEDLRVIIIKLADRLHNMETLENIEKPEKRIRIASETLEIYVPIANLLGIRWLKIQLEDLCFKHLFPTECKQLDEKLDSTKIKRKSAIDKFTKIISDAARAHDLKVQIVPRGKHLYSIYKKICSLGKNIDDIDARIGIRIVVEEVADCYQILGLIHSKFTPKTDRFKDYIANPKVNGYQSLHTTVFGPDGILVEIQIRTGEMNIEAEYGIAADFFHNHKISNDLKRSLWVKKVLEIDKTDKDSEDFMENLKGDILHDRIFVFTPKGTAIDLPEDATAIDFAYAIHTEVGHHALKADINGVLKPISTTLQNRDVVNIATSRKVTPELSWLSFAKTNLARNKILAFLKKISKEKKIKEGYKILQKEFDIAGLGLCENINFKKLQPILAKNFKKNLKDLEELFIAIGEGEIEAMDVVNIIKFSYKDIQKETPENREKMEQQGVKVHLKIVAKNRFRLLRDISDVLYKYALDMYSLKGWASRQEENAYFTAYLLVKDLRTVSHIFDELEQIDEVRSVYRISTRGIILFYILLPVVLGFWVFHPVILRILSNSVFVKHHPLTADFLIYGGLLVLIFMIFYLNVVLKKYFPVVRNKKLVWVFAFILPIAAISLLAMELLYFNLSLSWPVLLLEMILVYAYLAMSYRNFRKTIGRT